MLGVFESLVFSLSAFLSSNMHQQKAAAHISSSSSSSLADSAKFPPISLSFSLSLSLSLSPLPDFYPYRPSFLARPPDCIRHPHRDFIVGPTLVCPCVRVPGKNRFVWTQINGFKYWLVGWWVEVYGISTLVNYLILNHIYIYTV